MTTPDTLTVICAYDNAEAETVRRSLRPAGQVMEATDAGRLAGIHALDLHIVETPRFLARPDAGNVRKALHVAGLTCQQVRRSTHPGEGQPTPHLYGGTQPHLHRRDAARGGAGTAVAAATPPPYTVICAHNQREADTIRRRLALPRYSGPVVVARDVDQLHHELLGVKTARVIETSGFHDRADALDIRRELYLSRIDFGDWPKPGPALVDQVGGNGLSGFEAIAAAAAPAGTRPATYSVEMLSAGVRDDAPMWNTVREQQALVAGQPHMLLLLAPEDLNDDEHPLWPYHQAAGAGGWRALYTVTLRAIPGQTSHIVFRPAAGMPPGWLPPHYDGRWSPRPSAASANGITLALPPDLALVSARPTGLIEVRDDGAIAEVYEVQP